MAGHWTDEFSFITGVVRYHDLAYVALTGDDVAKRKVAQSLVAVWDRGEWKGEDGADKNWDTVGAAIAVKPLEQALFLGESGQILCIGSGDVHDEQIGTRGSGPATKGPMRGIRRIGESIYAVGMSRQVYLRDKSAKWIAADKGISPATGSGEVSGFEAVDGFDEKEVYAVGWDGEIWQYNGKTWSQKDSPTNYVLVDVCCAGDGNVYACGRVGALLRGRGDKWENIVHDSMSDDIWSMAWYNERLYLSTMDAVYTLSDDEFELVDMGKDQAQTCYTLSAADGVLWSIGAKDIMVFDGKQWSRVD